MRKAFRRVGPSDHTGSKVRPVLFCKRYSRWWWHMWWHLLTLRLAATAFCAQFPSHDSAGKSPDRESGHARIEVPGVDYCMLFFKFCALGYVTDCYTLQRRFHRCEIWGFGWNFWGFKTMWKTITVIVHRVSVFDCVRALSVPSDRITAMFHCTLYGFVWFVLDIMIRRQLSFC